MQMPSAGLWRLLSTILRLSASTGNWGLLVGGKVIAAAGGAVNTGLQVGNWNLDTNGAAILCIRYQTAPGNFGRIMQLLQTGTLRAISLAVGNIDGPDTGVDRSAAKVLGVTDAATGGGTLRSIPLTPTQITADQNNYAPGVARFYRLSTDAGRTLTGLSVGQVDGQECEIWNVGSNSIVLAHQSASSTAANRFICTGAADVTLAPDEVALLRFDATSSRWRVRKV